jgi:hypothetical protein
MMRGTLPELGPTSSSGPDAYWPLRAEAGPFQSTVMKHVLIILEREYTRVYLGNGLRHLDYCIQSSANELGRRLKQID